MKKIHTENINEAYLRAREEPPSSGDLHSRIAAAAEELPQSIKKDSQMNVAHSSSAKTIVNRRLLNSPWRQWFSLRPLALTGASVFALSLLVLTFWLPQLQTDPIAPLVETTAVNSENVQMVWDELLLLQDELAFAQL